MNYLFNDAQKKVDVKSTATEIGFLEDMRGKNSFNPLNIPLNQLINPKAQRFNDSTINLAVVVDIFNNLSTQRLLQQ